MSRKRLPIGARLRWKADGEITAVRKTGYDWRYVAFGKICPSGHRNSFMSENSTDPFFESPQWIHHPRDSQ